MHNIDKIKDTDLYKFQLLSTLLKLSEDNNYIKINDIINSRLQSNKNDIFALLVKLDLTSTTNSCTNIFNTIFLIVEATKENHYSSVTNNIILGYCLAIGRQWAYMDSDTLNSRKESDINTNTKLQSIYVLYHLLNNSIRREIQGEIQEEIQEQSMQ